MTVRSRPIACKRAHGRFTAGARALNENFDFLQAVPHRLTRGILRDHLRRVSGALARAFESNFARARPADDVAFQVGDRDDRVVESGEDVRDTGVNVLTSLGLDDLRLLDVVRDRAKDFPCRCRRRRGRLRGFFGAFFAGFWFGSAGGCAQLPRADASPLWAASLWTSAASAFPLPLPSQQSWALSVSCRRSIWESSSTSAVRLNFACFRVLVADDADRLARTFAGARVGRGALAAHRQAAAMPDPAITIDRLQTLQIALHFAAQIAFDRRSCCS